MEDIVVIIFFTLLVILLLVILAIALYLFLTIRDIRRLVKLLSDENGRDELAREQVIQIISRRFGFLAPIIGIILARYINQKFTKKSKD